MNRTHVNVMFFLSLITLALMTFFVASAQAESAFSTATSGGLFTGTYEGILLGEDGSEAPVTLELTQAGRAVTAEIAVGRGLLVDGGVCGVATVPAGSQSGAGRVPTNSPRHLDATAEYVVQGINVGLTLSGDLSRDGQTLTTTARIDLPWLCGRDPVITGELTRVD
jgi:hypothetical protein